LAARKSFEENGNQVQQKKDLKRFHPYIRAPTAFLTDTALPTRPVDIISQKWPFAVNTINNGDLTIVRSSPSPPQNEPVDFSTKKTMAPVTATKPMPIEVVSSTSGAPVSFSSIRELKFAKNLKTVMTEICRRRPTEGHIIINYMKFAWNKCNSHGTGMRGYTAANGQPSQSGMLSLDQINF
jgi:hypothetical protein